MTLADKQRLFKKKFFGRAAETLKHMILQGTEGTATRAIYTGHREIPKIEVCFKVPHSKDPRTGESFDAIEIEMDLWAATDFAQQLLNSISAATPQMPRPASRTMYGE